MRVRGLKMKMKDISVLSMEIRDIYYLWDGNTRVSLYNFSQENSLFDQCKLEYFCVINERVSLYDKW